MKYFTYILRNARRNPVRSILTIASVLALAYVMNYSGATASLGLAMAATGALFPFFGALLGWLGVFLTGSDTSANALFGNLQVVTANNIGLDPALMAAGNSSGGVMGKMISLQSISVAAAATGMPASHGITRSMATSSATGSIINAQDTPPLRPIANVDSRTCLAGRGTPEPACGRRVSADSCATSNTTVTPASRIPTSSVSGSTSNASSTAKAPLTLTVNADSGS